MSDNFEINAYYSSKSNNEIIYNLRENDKSSQKKIKITNTSVSIKKNDIIDIVTLNLMFLDEEIKNLMNVEEDLIILLESLINFNFQFSNLFIVIDTKNKKQTKSVDEFDISYLINYLKKCKIITNDANIKIDFLQYYSKESEYKKILMEIFNYKDVDQIKIYETYKNAFAYYYSLYHSPTKFLVHIDKPRKNRYMYQKNNDSNSDNFVLKGIQLLKKYENIRFVNNLCLDEDFIQISINNSDSYEYSIYFDNKPNLSLTCWVADISKIKNQWPWNCIWYKYQTENALTRSMGLGNSLVIFPFASNVNRVKYNLQNYHISLNKILKLIKN